MLVVDIMYTMNKYITVKRIWILTPVRVFRLKFLFVELNSLLFLIIKFFVVKRLHDNKMQVLGTFTRLYGSNGFYNTFWW